MVTSAKPSDQRNVQIVLDAFDALFNKRDYAAAERFWSPRYIQHSARVLFVIAQAGAPERAQILDAIFDLSREEILKGVEARTLGKIALNAHDYVYDVFPGVAAGWA